MGGFMSCTFFYLNSEFTNAFLCKADFTTHASSGVDDQRPGVPHVFETFKEYQASEGEGKPTMSVLSSYRQEATSNKGIATSSKQLLVASYLWNLSHQETFQILSTKSSG